MHLHSNQHNHSVLSLLSEQVEFFQNFFFRFSCTAHKARSHRLHSVIVMLPWEEMNYGPNFLITPAWETVIKSNRNIRAFV